jgi:hypothetical protein
MVNFPKFVAGIIVGSIILLLGAAIVTIAYFVIGAIIVMLPSIIGFGVLLLVLYIFYRGICSICKDK